MRRLNDSIEFPPLNEANSDGLLAIGGDLSPKRVLYAYKNGIFPWYEADQPLLWWSPNPRFVLYPNKLKISKRYVKKSNTGVLPFLTNNGCFVGNSIRSEPPRTIDYYILELSIFKSTRKLIAAGTPVVEK